jgi:hypothetical protein
MKQGIQITRKHTNEGTKITVKKIGVEYSADSDNGEVESLRTSDERVTKK